MFIISVGFVVSAEAQSRSRTSVSTTQRRPVVVRRVIYRDPFWRSRYWRYYDPFYDPFYRSPYLRLKDREAQLRNELAGNRRELEKHLKKYQADGVITDKEQRELDDDYKDVANAERKLKQFLREYSLGE